MRQSIGMNTSVGHTNTMCSTVYHLSPKYHVPHLQKYLRWKDHQQHVKLHCVQCFPVSCMYNKASRSADTSCGYFCLTAAVLHEA